MKILKLEIGNTYDIKFVGTTHGVKLSHKTKKYQDTSIPLTLYRYFAHVIYNNELYMLIFGANIKLALKEYGHKLKVKDYPNLYCYSKSDCKFIDFDVNDFDVNDFLSEYYKNEFNISYLF